MGRVALAALLDTLHIEDGDEALVPWYHCGSEIDPLIRAGLRVTPYHVDEKLRIDVADLEAKLSPRTRVVYVTHYFGWPQDLSTLAHACTNVGATLIEDCALALFSGPASRPVGTVGDAAIFSFPKSLGVPDGGAVAVRGALDEVIIHRPAPLLSVVRMALRLMRRWANMYMAEVGFLKRFARRSDRRWARNWNSRIRDNARLREMPDDYALNRRLLDRNASRMTRGVLHSVDPLDVSTRRRSNFIQLVNALGDLAPELLIHTTLPDAVCPLAAPLLTPDRDHWVGALREAGIAVTPWWDGFHPALMDNPPPEVVRLKTQMIALPVHQGLREKDMHHIADCVRRLAFGEPVGGRLSA
jgi:dTDP-4-amino-4,6-dideoxygalactose transaminase